MRNYIHLPRWVVALVLYLLVILSLFATKPSLMFNNDGSMKDFGIGMKQGKSIIAPSVFFPILAVFCFFISTILYIAV